MRIAVPSADSSGLKAMISEHFGRSPYFAVYDTENDELEVVPNTNPHHGPTTEGGQHLHQHSHLHNGLGHHGHGYAFRSLSEKEVDILVCRGLGMRAMQLFREKGIKIFCGAEGSVSDAIDLYKDGKLQEAGPQHACHHGHHH